ncbi:MAG TPA: hypothetical protein VFW11_21540 [Cyclobacteriaceae bacterium]|nr:hypothetical protein [Cyclobacteriaceae bacterium]
MKNIHRLMTEITQLTSNIETNYPDLYQFLNENPITIPSDKHPSIDKVILENYLETLKHLLRHYIDDHKR